MLTDTINRYEVGLQCVFKTIINLSYTIPVYNSTYKGSLKRCVLTFQTHILTYVAFNFLTKYAFFYTFLHWGFDFSYSSSYYQSLRSSFGLNRICVARAEEPEWFLRQLRPLVSSSFIAWLIFFSCFSPNPNNNKKLFMLLVKWWLLN